MSTHPFDVDVRAEMRVVIAFLDLTRYTARVMRLDAAVLAETMDEYYRRVTAAAEAGGGRAVKFFGDGALLAFPIERADDAAVALLELKEEIDAWCDALGWDSRLVVKVHAGSPIGGPFGPERRFDILGRDVNIAATVDTRGFALTAEAFRALAPATRTRFKKHTPPSTYIRTTDRHPHRTGRHV